MPSDYARGVAGWRIASVLVLLWLACASAQCPNSKECKCDYVEGKVIINCRREGLDAVPAFDDTNQVFEELTLNTNKIGDLPAGGFQTQNGEGLKVKKLDLGNNPITSIDHDAFEGLEDTLEELILHVSAMVRFPMLQQLTKLKRLELKGFAMNALPAGALTGLSQLTDLSLKNCQLNSLQASDFTSQLYTLESINLDGNAFTDIPKAALGPLIQLTTLSISATDISVLSSNAFYDLDNLQTLDLSRNALQSISTDAFVGLETVLKTLKLSHAQLHTSDLRPLNILSGLEVLDLDNNRIDSLPNNLFNQMSKLKWLNLNGCELRVLTPDSFAGLGASLNELNLASNSIMNINTGSFRALTGLKNLHLDQQGLTGALNEKTFSGLEDSLEYLSLEETQLTTDNLPAVGRLSSLTTLRLQKNNINSLPDSIFANLGTLKTLELSGNEISGVNARSFYGLQPSLGEINLNSNKLTTINKCVFFDFDVLKTIKLDFNPLHCDCHLKWLRKWLYRYNDTNDLILFRWKCDSPDEHEGKYLRDVPVSALTCESEPPAEECEPYEPPVVPTTATPPDFTTQPVSIAVNVSDVTDSGFRVDWALASSDHIRNFLLQVTDMSSGIYIVNDLFAAHKRSHEVAELAASTDYNACVTAHFNDESLDNTDCHSAMTAPAAGGSTDGVSMLAIILGSVIGVLAFVILLSVVIFFLRRYNRRKDPFYVSGQNNNELGLPQSRVDAPQMGYNSKRFSKPKDAGSLANLSSVDLERRIDGFTQEERDRIINLLTHSGASTLSVLSSASSHRYLHEPLPHSARRYPLAQYPSGEYAEIPVDQYEYIPADKVEKYDYIPASEVGKYEYIPASKVKKEEQSDPPPELPKGRPDTGSTEHLDASPPASKWI